MRKEVRPRVVAICEGGIEGERHRKMCMAVAHSLGKWQPIAGYGMVVPFCEKVCWHSCNGESHAGGQARQTPAQLIVPFRTHACIPFCHRTTASWSARARAAHRTRASLSLGTAARPPPAAPLRALPCAGSARPCCTRTSRTSTTPSARSRRPRRRARPRRRRRPRARLCPRRPRRRRRRRRPRPTSSSATATSSRTTTPTARSSPTPRARASSPTTPRSTARPTCCASRLRRARASTSTTAASGCACAHP